MVSMDFFFLYVEILTHLILKPVSYQNVECLCDFISCYKLKLKKKKEGRKEIVPVCGSLNGGMDDTGKVTLLYSTQVGNNQMVIKVSEWAVEVSSCSLF